jgi:multicomponent Na+:H+ antiporter subunit G
MIGRTSYFIGTELWKGTIINELKDQYDEESHVLYSSEEQKEEAAQDADKEPE